VSANEGWTWLHNSRKWHYFKGGRAVCGGFMLLAHPSEGYQTGNDNSPDNCAACKRKRLAPQADNEHIL
jgi:hypothetical protein